MRIDRRTNQKENIALLILDLIVYFFSIFILLYISSPPIILILGLILLFIFLTIDIVMRISFFRPISIEITGDYIQSIDHIEKKAQRFKFMDESTSIRADIQTKDGTNRVFAIHLSNSEERVEISVHRGWQQKDIQAIWENLSPYVERYQLMKGPTGKS